MARACAPNEAMDVASESANTGRRRRSTGSSGAGSLSCRRTSATPIATAGGDLDYRGPRGAALADAVHAGDDQSERERIEEHAQKIEAAAGARRRWQRPRRHYERNHSDRHVDQKQPMPGGDRQDRRRDARASGRADGDHHRYVADPLAKPRVRIDEADERDVDAHDSRRAQALNHAREGEHGECRASAQESEATVKSASPHQ